MAEFEPPLTPEDTQPTHTRIHFDDTNPTAPIRPKSSHKARWIVLGIVGGLILIIAVIALIAVLIGNNEEDPTAISIQFVVDGQALLVDTFAETVADLLIEQDVTIDSGDYLSHQPTTALEANMRVEITHAQTVLVTRDGNTSIVHTLTDNPLEIIENAGVTLTDTDRILIDNTRVTREELATWDSVITSIDIQSAFTFQIQDGTTLIDMTTNVQTVGEALTEAGISLFLADNVTPDVSTSLAQDMLITITRSRELTIVADGNSTQTRTNAETLGEALSEAGIVLSGLDYVVPDETTAVISGLSARVIRVTEEIITEEEVIPYNSALQADASLNLDARQVIQAGQTGLQQYTYRIRYENGVEISRDLELNEQIRPPVSEIVAYGTNVVIRVLNTPNGPVEYWRRLRVYATSYHPAALGGDDITATGERLRFGVVAADPTVISYYTNVYIEGYGVGTIYDTGGPRSTPYWIDLGYSDDDFVGWSRWAEVYILTPVPENVNYLIPLNENGGPLP